MKPHDFIYYMLAVEVEIDLKYTENIFIYSLVSSSFSYLHKMLKIKIDKFKQTE